MAEVQKSLERYDVLHRIAVGGMAEVFLAKAYGAHGFEKTLAIKRILPELARDPEFEDRFIAEAKVAVKLSHTNIVQVFDFGRFASSLFIAMEYVDGIDLAALLRRHRDAGRLVPLPAAFHIAIEIARGLDYAHTHGVVHRDVSPSNILLSRSGEVKITDFGIAVAARPDQTRSGVRKIMGKWRYMSPEQARGEEVDTRSDLFSAASVMFELFTGEKLFPGEESEDILRNIHEMPLPRASQLRPGLPARLDDILHLALARRPGDRPARAAVIQRALTELSYESSIVATALDVAEAVSGVIDDRTPSRRTSLDDIIRRQIASALGGEKTDSRFTAIEPSRETAVATDPQALAGPPLVLPPPDSPLKELDETGRVTLVQSIDDDGVSVLAIDPAAAPPPVPSRDRRTPTAAEVAAAARPGRWWLGAGALAAGMMVAIGAGVWLARSPSSPIGAPDPPPEPPPAPVVGGILEIDSVPTGATGTVDDQAIGPTPVRLDVPADRPLVVRLQLAGRQPYVDDRVIVEAGRTVRLRAVLPAARARLQVTTEPPGASVILDGRVVGETPLDLDNLEPGSAELALVHSGYERWAGPVPLRAGEVSALKRTLRPVPHLGAIDLYIDEGWAEVYLRNKRVGRAPVKGLRLPVGRQRLRLVNPPSGKERFLDVEVVDGEVRYYRTAL